MIITSISVETLYIPLQKPFITALRRVENVEFVRVHIYTNTMQVAIGEAPATQAITGENIETITHCIKAIITPKILLTSPDYALEILHSLCQEHSSAKAAIDMALYHLLNRPLSSLKGAIQSDITISLNPPKKMLSDAHEAYENGYSILKVKVGLNDGEDVNRINLIAQALPKVAILVDANQAWSKEQTLSIIKCLTCKNIKLIEQPVKATELVALKTITKASHIPILADESAFTLNDVRNIVENNIADMINIKLMKCAGITKAIEILEYCRKYKISCMMGSMLEGPYSIRAAIQLSLAYKDVITYSDLDSPFLYQNSYPQEIITLSRDSLIL